MPSSSSNETETAANGAVNSKNRPVVSEGDVGHSSGDGAGAADVAVVGADGTLVLVMLIPPKMRGPFVFVVGPVVVVVVFAVSPFVLVVGVDAIGAPDVALDGADGSVVVVVPSVFVLTEDGRYGPVVVVVDANKDGGTKTAGVGDGTKDRGAPYVAFAVLVGTSTR
jgi:hypothetical protein